MQINKKTVYFKRFSQHNNNNFEMDLLDNSGKFKSWHVFKMEYNLNHKFYFQCLQLTDVQNNILFKIILAIKAPSIKDHHLYEGPE